MPSLKDLRTRIKSVKNTQQITKTMKMVAAAKVRKARMRCEEARPYAEEMHKVLRGIAANTDAKAAPPMFAGRDDVKTVRVLVFGSDRGLCGGFNGNLVKEAIRLVNTHAAKGRKVEIITLGRKPKDLLKTTHGQYIAQSHDDITKEITFEKAAEIAHAQVQAFESGACDQVVMVFNRFVSMVTQTPTPEQLIPFKVEGEESEGMPTGVEYEPEEEAILKDLLPRNVTTQILRALLESGASEHAARMSAMDSATSNAGDMINRLSIEYNRSRQAAITTELIEIIAGAEAL